MERNENENPWCPKFKLDEEVTAGGSSLIRIVRKIIRNQDGTFTYTLGNGSSFNEDKLRRVKKPYPNMVHYLIGDRVECVHGFWTDGTVIGYDQDLYLYVQVKDDTKHCHFADIKLCQEHLANLAPVLKDCIGKSFFSPLLGDVILVKVDEALHFQYQNAEFITTQEGTDDDGNIVVFPSKQCRDWNKWLQSIRPSAWKEITPFSIMKPESYQEFLKIDNIQGDMSEAAMAFLKLNFLLKYCYSSDDELSEAKVKRFLTYYENRLLLSQILNHKV